MPIDIGQRLKKVFTLVNSGDLTALPLFCDDGKFDCDFMLPVYANTSGLDLENDKSGFLVTSQNWVTAIALTLDKKIGSSFVEQTTLVDNTYGDFFAFGDFASNPTYSGIVLHWDLVLAAFGEGEYRIKAVETYPLGTRDLFSKSFCLKTFNCSPDNTVRLEWNLNGGFGDIENDRDIVDYGTTNFFFQVRIPLSFFGYPRSEYETEEVQFSNGEFEDITSVQTETYVLKLGSIPAWLHNILKTYALESGSLLITDYSNNNPQEFIQKAVRRKSSYEPRYKQNNKCAPVTIELQPQFNRLEKDRCL